MVDHISDKMVDQTVNNMVNYNFKESISTQFQAHFQFDKFKSFPGILSLTKEAPKEKHIVPLKYTREQ